MPSILSKAFRGELVPTEAELARQENRTYDPASALLEKIKSTHTAAEKKKKNTTRKTPRNPNRKTYLIHRNRNVNYGKNPKAYNSAKTQGGG